MSIDSPGWKEVLRTAILLAREEREKERTRAQNGAITGTPTL